MILPHVFLDGLPVVLVELQNGDTLDKDPEVLVLWEDCQEVLGQPALAEPLNLQVLMLPQSGSSTCYHIGEDPEVQVLQEDCHEVLGHLALVEPLHLLVFLHFDPLP